MSKREYEQFVPGLGAVNLDVFEGHHNNHYENIEDTEQVENYDCHITLVIFTKTKGNDDEYRSSNDEEEIFQ